MKRQNRSKSLSIKIFFNDDLAKFKDRVGNVNKPVINSYPLLLAINHEADDIFNDLLCFVNINLDVVDCDGEGPLHYAVRTNRIDYVRLLIDRGIDVNRCNNKNEDPLSLAIIGNQRDIILLLIYTGANITEHHLMMIMEYSTPYIFNFAIKHQLLINKIPSRIYSDLFVYTIKHKCFQFIDVLLDCVNQPKLKYIINRRRKCFFKRTILHMMVIYDNKEYVEKLIDYGALVNLGDRHGNTPLHYVKSIEVARVLMEHGANPNVFNIKNYTPFTLVRADSKLNKFIGEYHLRYNWDDLSTLSSLEE